MQWGGNVVNVVFAGSLRFGFDCRLAVSLIGMIHAITSHMGVIPRLEQG